MVLDPFQLSKAVTKNQFLETGWEPDNPKATPGSVNILINQHLDGPQTLQSIPQKDLPLTILRCQLENHINVLQVHLTGNFAEPVFNLHGIGQVDREDRKIKKVIAPLQSARTISSILCRAANSRLHFWPLSFH
jgi:hypothetical protein